MNKALVLICYHLGAWGFLGFVVTLLLGFITCSTNLSPNIFYSLLGVLALVGITATITCVYRGCKK